MQVIITARHCDISEDLRSLIERQVENLSRYESRATRAEVAVTGGKKLFEAEAIVSVDGADRVHASAQAEDMRSAVDRMVEKLSVQLRRRHKRRREHRAPPMDELFGSPSEVPQAEGSGEA